MNVSVSALGDMVNNSVEVLRKPSIATFERYEKRGTLQQAALYAVIGALIAAVLGAGGGVFGVIQNALGSLLAFAIVVGVVYRFGKNQGGTGTLAEVAYTFALFAVPLGVLWPATLLILWAVPILGWCLIPFALLAGVTGYVFYGYLAVQSSMNIFDPRKALVTLGVAALAMVAGTMLIGSIL